MGSSAIPFLLQQLVYQGPMLIVYLVGIILAFRFLERCRVASILTILAIGTLLLVSIASGAAQAYVVSSKSPSQVGQAFLIIGIISSVMRAIAFGLLVAAIFVGRDESAPPLNPPQFGLRALLIGVTLFCLAAGLISILTGWTS